MNNTCQSYKDLFAALVRHQSAEYKRGKVSVGFTNTVLKMHDESVLCCEQYENMARIFVLPNNYGEHKMFNVIMRHLKLPLRITDTQLITPFGHLPLAIETFTDYRRYRPLSDYFDPYKIDSIRQEIAQNR